MNIAAERRLRSGSGSRLFLFLLILLYAVDRFHNVNATVTCEGRPIGHSTCKTYNSQESCDAGGEHCIWWFGGCQVFDECMTSLTEDDCLEDSFCEWANVCYVARTGAGEMGGCILINDKDVCSDQAGCTWVGPKNIMAPILVIVAFVIILIGAGYGIWICCRRRRNRRLATEQGKDEQQQQEQQQQEEDVVANPKSIASPHRGSGGMTPIAVSTAPTSTTTITHFPDGSIQKDVEIVNSDGSKTITSTFLEQTF